MGRKHGENFSTGSTNEDVDLRRQVELLLANEEKAGSFLDAPVVENLTGKCCGCGSGTVNHEIVPAALILEAEV